MNVSFTVSLDPIPAGAKSFDVLWWTGVVGTGPLFVPVPDTGTKYEQNDVPAGQEAVFNDVPAQGQLNVIAHRDPNAAPWFLPKMMAQWMQVVSGELKVNLDTRTVDGLLLPYTPPTYAPFGDPKLPPPTDTPIGPITRPPLTSSSGAKLTLTTVLVIGLLVLLAMAVS